MIGVGAAGPLGVSHHDADRPRGLAVVTADASRSAPVERAAWISLASIPGIGPVGFAAVVRRFGSAVAALQAPPAEIIRQLPRSDAETDDALRRLQGVGWPTVAADLEEAARRVGGAVVTALDPAYPASLARLDGRPPVLYVVGHLDVLALPAVAVVGTRRPSGYGLSAAADIADEIARAGVTVVSGLALGIDGHAHLAALDAGGRTVAVLPSPIDRVYPPRHRDLAARIVAEGGALVSESPPGRQSGKPDFARRNRIISGLSEATVVIEAPDRSGALLTASAALAQGRDLYAVPGPIDSMASRGCNRLIADHQAELVTSSASLLHRLGLSVRRPQQAHVVASLSDTEGLVLGALIKRSGSIEELGARSHLATSELASALTLLEARGLVASYGGVTFHATLAARRIVYKTTELL
ncbi:MAG: DNA-protecting protein DprA [Chloroflexi bacterium]|nr:MAG: DNA-protecting protein DprA [Chloroflexota bacterium]